MCTLHFSVMRPPPGLRTHPCLCPCTMSRPDASPVLLLFVRDACRRVPAGLLGITPEVLASRLAEQGAIGPQDFERLGDWELQRVWPALRPLPSAVACALRDASPAWLERKAASLANLAAPPAKRPRLGGAAPVDSPTLALIRDSFSVIVLAREASQPPEARHLSAVIRVMAKATSPPAVFDIGNLPRQRAAALARRGVCEDAVWRIRMNSVWTEFNQWRVSAREYASALECWACACEWVAESRASDVQPPIARLCQAGRGAIMATSAAGAGRARYGLQGRRHLEAICHGCPFRASLVPC